MRRNVAALAVLICLLGVFACRASAPQRRPAPVAEAEAVELAGGAEHWGRPYPGPTHPPLGAYMRGDRRYRLVALTFDDGPDAVFTPQVLDVLKRNGVKATFFLVGRRAAARPDLVRRIVAEGHEIGNHSYNHPLLTGVPEAKVWNELSETDKLLSGITGQPVYLFRPPYGALNPTLLKVATSLGYKVVTWDIDSLDWKKGMTKDGVLDHVVPNLRPGAIILQHSAGGKGENLSDTVEALPLIIRTIKGQGYSPVTVTELLSTGRAVPGEW